MPIRVTLDPRLLDAGALDQYVTDRVASRLSQGDPTLWGNASAERAASRLGWIAAISRIAEVVERCQVVADSLSPIDYDRVFLCGMGGSSLAPQVISVDSPIDLIAVDTLHPDRLDALITPDSLSRSVVVVSSKSGVTTETRAQLALIEERLRDAGVEPRDRIIAITDPGSDLAEHAQEHGYRLVLTDPSVGGRYSALIEFGILPALLAHADLSGFAAHAQTTLDRCATDDAANPLVQVAAFLARQAAQGVSLQFVENELPLLPAWIEQLIAESTGHDGKGLLPIPRQLQSITDTAGPVILVNANAPDTPQASPRADLTVTGSLASQFVFWELVTATVSRTLRVNPFEQPDVERTKAAARQLQPGDIPADGDHELAPGLFLQATQTEWSTSIEGLGHELVARAGEATYIVFQAFVSEPGTELERLAELLEQRANVPVAVNYGPQYLHSTGQLHKGGPVGGLFVSIIEEPRISLAVPGADTTFNWLLEAMARADLRVLEELGRTGLSLRLTNDKALTPLMTAVEGSSPR